jgi:hypothetical protein
MGHTIQNTAMCLTFIAQPISLLQLTFAMEVGKKAFDIKELKKEHSQFTFLSCLLPKHQTLRTISLSIFDDPADIPGTRYSFPCFIKLIPINFRPNIKAAMLIQAGYKTYLIPLFR